MDRECVKICNALNRLPSVRTFESCCGHGTDDFRVWFYVSDVRVINLLGRLTSHNYSKFGFYRDQAGEYCDDWRIILDTNDVMDYGSDAMFMLCGNRNNPGLYAEADEMAEFLLDSWNSFCRYTLKTEPFYKPDGEYAEIVSSYMRELR